MKKISVLTALLLILASSVFAEKVSFNAKTIENKTVTEAIFEDAELTMINIWGTFCGPCINEMPDLAKLNRNYSEKGFQVVGIVIDSVNRKGLPVPKTVDAAKKIAKQTGADYIHIVPDIKLQSSLLAGVTAVPATVFVNKDGEIVGSVYTGSRSYEEWKKIVDKLMAK